MKEPLKERLIIQNFAGIKDITLDVNKINVLIGPQATGKSVCAKLLYFFKSFPFQMSRSIGYYKKFDDFSQILIERFKVYFPPDCLGAEDYRIRYELADGNFLQISKKMTTEEPEFLCSEYFTGMWKKFSEHFTRLEKEVSKEDKINIYSDMLFRRGLSGNIIKDLEKTFSYRQILIPAGRSYMTLFLKDPFIVDQVKSPMDLFVKEFGSLYLSIKDYFYGNKIFSADKTLNSLIKKVLLGDYIQEKEDEFIKHNDGRIVKITLSSSGQQEILPLILTLRFLCLPGFMEFGASVYIEEPEAHMFPLWQKYIVELIAAVYNMSEMPLQFFITTHSPYILTSFNNLLQAGMAREANKDNEEKLSQLYKIIPDEQIISPGELNAYSLTEKGLKDIIDKETGLILAKEIDRVSDRLSTNFYNLLDLEK